MPRPRARSIRSPRWRASDRRRRRRRGARGSSGRRGSEARATIGAEPMRATVVWWHGRDAPRMRRPRSTANATWKSAWLASTVDRDAPRATGGVRASATAIGEARMPTAATSDGGGRAAAGERVRGRRDDRRDPGRRRRRAARARGVGSRHPPRCEPRRAARPVAGHGQLKARRGYRGRVDVIAFVIGVVLLVVGLAVSIALHELGHLLAREEVRRARRPVHDRLRPDAVVAPQRRDPVRVQGDSARRLHLDGGHVPALTARARRSRPPQRPRRAAASSPRWCRMRAPPTTRRC